MSISSTTNSNQYTGNGATSSYSYTFRVFENTDLLVTVTDTDDVETTLTITTDYTVSDVGEESGGSVALVSASQSWLDGSGNLLTGYKITIRRVVDLVQETDIRNQGDFFPEVHEDFFDYAIMIAQQQQNEIDRSVKNPESVLTSAFDPTLPTDIATANVSIVTNGSGNGFIVGPTTTEISNAQTYATNASASATLAENWAIKTDGIVASTDYSSKAWSIGGTDVTDTAGRGAAKEWATKAEDSTVDGTEFSAKHYAAKAAASASEAATTAAASQWSDVVYVTNADSPVAIVDGDAGKLYSVDASGGAVTFNLPAISGLTLDGPWSLGIKKTDSSANAITVNRNGTDTIGGATSKEISRQFAGVNFIPDTDATPDDWTTLTFGEVPIDGAIVGTTDVQDLSGKTFTDAITLEEQASTPSNPASGDKKFYAKNDGGLYTLDSAGNEIPVGAGGGGGGVLYINADAETGVTDLVAYADAAGTEPVDATGGSPTLAVSEETSNPLIGSKSFLITKDAANRQGEGVAITSETIGEAYQDSVHTVEFLWKPSATVVADALKIFVVHPTTGTVEALYFRDYLGNYTNSLPNDNSRVHRIVAEIAPIDPTYKVVVHVAGTDTTAYTGLIDNIQAGPQRLLNGVYQNSETINLAGSGDFTAGTLLVERVGNLVSVTQKGDLTHSSTTVADSAAGEVPAWARPNSTTNNQSRSDTRVNVLSDGTFRINYDTAQTGETTVSTVSYVVDDDIQATNVLGSTQIDQSTLNFYAEGNGGTSITGSATNIDFTEVDDPFNCWDGTTFTAPARMRVRFYGSIRRTGGTSASNVFSYVNGSQSKLIGAHADTGNVSYTFNGWENLEAGDTLSIRTDASFTLDNVPLRHWIALEALPDFSVIGSIREKNLVQTKYLPSDVTSTTANVIQFENLVIGQMYELILAPLIEVDGGARGDLTADHNGSTIGRARFDGNGGGGSFAQISLNRPTIFKAEATTVDIDFTVTGSGVSLEGGNGELTTYCRLIKRNDLRETDQY
jgi:hypothetical protein